MSACEVVGPCFNGKQLIGCNQFQSLGRFKLIHVDIGQHHRLFKKRKRGKFTNIIRAGLMENRRVTPACQEVMQSANNQYFLCNYSNISLLQNLSLLMLLLAVSAQYYLFNFMKGSQ